MKAIKKVQVTPLDYNFGKIIDSFNTSDNKHVNAPSLEAVETELTDIKEDISDINSDISDINSDISDINGKFAVLDGNLNISGDLATGIFNFPEGFTVNNSVIISAMVQTDVSINANAPWKTIGFTDNDTIINNIYFIDDDNSTFLNVVYKMWNGETTCRTRIVLMKIS